MSHVALVAMSGFRVREREMIALGMALPGLAARAGAVGALPALGLLTIAAHTPDHWTQSYHEIDWVADGAVDGAADAIAAEHPTIAAISALSASIDEAYSLSDRLRQRGILTVMGGLHVSMCPDEALRHADIVVIGDGEPVWAQLLDDVERRCPKRIYTSSAPFDLGESRVPRFDLLGGRERPRYTLQTARGCPLSCDFCGASRLLGPFREKPVEVIERELRQLGSSGRRLTIELADDNTLAGRRDPAPLLSAFARSGVRWFTEMDWRIGERPELLKMLAAAGCVQVLVGFESLVHAHEGMGAKRAKLARMVDACLAIQDEGVAVIGCFIVGSDGETLESMAELGEFLVDVPLCDVQITMLTPFPGTALHRRFASEGRLLDRGWSAYTLFDATFVPERLSVEELEQGFRNVVAMAHAPGPASTRLARRQDVWRRRGDMEA